MKGLIMIVEDNLLNRELLTDWLAAEGFKVLTAEDLEQAFQILGTNRPEAILLDVQLGSEDGLALATWVRKSPELKTIPVIAVTAHAMVTDQERVITAGCNACLSKPIDFKQLREQLELWLAATTGVGVHGEGGVD